jgi:hypothetical protein
MPIQKQPACCQRKTVSGKEQLIFETASGQRITLSGGQASVVVEDNIGNSVVNGGTVTVRAVGKIVLQASIVEIDAPAGEPERGICSLHRHSAGQYGDSQHCQCSDMRSGCRKHVVIAA